MSAAHPVVDRQRAALDHDAGVFKSGDDFANDARADRDQRRDVRRLEGGRFFRRHRRDAWMHFPVVSDCRRLGGFISAVRPAGLVGRHFAVAASGGCRPDRGGGFDDDRSVDAGVWKTGFVDRAVWRQLVLLFKDEMESGFDFAGGRAGELGAVRGFKPMVDFMKNMKRFHKISGIINVEDLYKKGDCNDEICCGSRYWRNQFESGAR